MCIRDRDIGVAAIIGVGLILVTRCIDADEAWDSIDGNVLVLSLIHI